MHQKTREETVPVREGSHGDEQGCGSSHEDEISTLLGHLILEHFHPFFVSPKAITCHANHNKYDYSHHCIVNPQHV
jgi:hypothetical protein